MVSESMTDDLRVFSMILVDILCDLSTETEDLKLQGRSLAIVGPRPVTAADFNRNGSQDRRRWRTDTVRTLIRQRA